MKPQKYIVMKGIQTILQECSYNLKIFKEHIQRECEPCSQGQIYYALSKAKEFLSKNIEFNAIDEEIFSILEIDKE